MIQSSSDISVIHKETQIEHFRESWLGLQKGGDISIFHFKPYPPLWTFLGKDA